MALSSALSSVLNWLHAGYPQGIPQQDYIPLVALLQRRLTPAQLADVVAELSGDDDPTTADAIRQAISAVTYEAPSDNDVARVGAKLAAAGWPLADGAAVSSS